MRNVSLIKSSKRTVDLNVFTFPHMREIKAWSHACDARKTGFMEPSLSTFPRLEDPRVWLASQMLCRVALTSLGGYGTVYPLLALPAVECWLFSSIIPSFMGWKLWENQSLQAMESS